MTLRATRIQLVTRDVIRKNLPATREAIADHVALVFPVSSQVSEEERAEIVRGALLELEEHGYERASTDDELPRPVSLRGEALIRAGAAIIRENPGMPARAVYHAICAEHRVSVPIGTWEGGMHNRAVAVAASDLNLEQPIPPSVLRTVRDVRKHATPHTSRTNAEPPGSDESPQQESTMDTQSGGTTTSTDAPLKGKALAKEAAKIIQANPSWGSREVFAELVKNFTVEMSLSSFQAGGFTAARKEAGVTTSTRRSPGRPKPKAAGAKKRAARSTPPPMMKKSSGSGTKGSKSGTNGASSETMPRIPETKSPNGETGDGVQITVQTLQRKLSAAMNGSGLWHVEMTGVTQAELDAMIAETVQGGAA